MDTIDEYVYFLKEAVKAVEQFPEYEAPMNEPPGSEVYSLQMEPRENILEYVAVTTEDFFLTLLNREIGNEGERMNWTDAPIQEKLREYFTENELSSIASIVEEFNEGQQEMVVENENVEVNENVENNENDDDDEMPPILNGGRRRRRRSGVKKSAKKKSKKDKKKSARKTKGKKKTMKKKQKKSRKTRKQSRK